nr:RNA-directed DNA polymerase, eukaryota [Tanacetum cinerariifolium]
MIPLVEEGGVNGGRTVVAGIGVSRSLFVKLLIASSQMGDSLDRLQMRDVKHEDYVNVVADVEQDGVKCEESVVVVSNVKQGKEHPLFHHSIIFSYRILRMHLHANVIRFEHTPFQQSQPTPPTRPGKIAPSFVSAVKGILPTPVLSPPAMVLDDSCGLWVMVELPSANSKSKFLAHVGVGSWFKSLSNPQPDFSPRDRIIWVDVEGVPMHAWSSNTFHKIGSMWGVVLELGDCKDECFTRK